jgi:hypothetical protein
MARRQFQDAFPDVIIQRSTVNFASAAASVSNGANVTVPGAGIGDIVLVTGAGEADGTFPSPAISGSFGGAVTAANTVRVVYHNDSAGTVDLDAITVVIVVLKVKAE